MIGAWLLMVTVCAHEAPLCATQAVKDYTTVQECHKGVDLVKAHPDPLLRRAWCERQDGSRKYFTDPERSLVEEEP